eukprot:1502946-Amphidinium_carterae.1
MSVVSQCHFHFSGLRKVLESEVAESYLVLPSFPTNAHCPNQVAYKPGVRFPTISVKMEDENLELGGLELATDTLNIKQGHG